MELYFYNCSDDHRKVYKTLGSPVWESTVMNPSEIVDLIRPSFSIIADPAMPLTYNYAYCPTLGRFYFVTGQQSLPGAKKVIECLVDVRKSFVNSQIPVTVIRNEFATNSNIPDNEFPVDPMLHGFKVIPLDGTVFSDSYRVMKTANTGINYELEEVEEGGGLFGNQ